MSNNTINNIKLDEKNKKNIVSTAVAMVSMHSIINNNNNINSDIAKLKGTLRRGSVKNTATLTIPNEIDPSLQLTDEKIFEVNINPTYLTSPSIPDDYKIDMDIKKQIDTTTGLDKVAIDKAVDNLKSATNVLHEKTNKVNDITP
jgi:hypothetical protein